MSVDILILNSAVVDFRSGEFDFVKKIVGPGGLAKCPVSDMPDYSQQHYMQWIEEGNATAGGSGNTAPLISRAGLKVAVGTNLGKGKFDGLDAQGRYFYDLMVSFDVDMSQTYIHPSLHTGTTFIYQKEIGERSGLAYFPNANDDFDFEHFKSAVISMNPKIVYYMYSGLSRRGDANGGKDLADFMKWCRENRIITIADAHTLTGNPQDAIDAGNSIKEYELLIPLLPQLDFFFISIDEAKLLKNTLDHPENWSQLSQKDAANCVLAFITHNFWQNSARPRVVGITVSDGAYVIKSNNKGSVSRVQKVTSRYKCGDVVDLVGAGDSFRAGFVTYVAQNMEQFKDGSINIEEAVQMGNLVASLYIKSPLEYRYENIGAYEKMYKLIEKNEVFDDFDTLKAAVKHQC